METHEEDEMFPEGNKVEREYNGRGKAWGVNTFLKCPPKRWYRCFRALLK